MRLTVLSVSHSVSQSIIQSVGRSVGRSLQLNRDDVSGRQRMTTILFNNPVIDLCSRQGTFFFSYRLDRLRLCLY